MTLHRRHIAVLLLLLAACGCAKNAGESPNGTTLQLPPFRDEETIARSQALSDSGYRFLSEGKTAEAIDVFTRQVELLPTGRWGAYNLACAHSRAGEIDAGIASISKAVEAGWDDTEHLRSDPDLQALNADPRYPDILRRAETLRAEHEAPFAQGLPEYDRSPVPATDAAAVSAWADSVSKGLQRQAQNWFTWETTTARLDFEARRLATLRDLNKGNAEFDYRRERMRTIAALRSPYERWGALARGVRKEVDAYLATNPEAEGKNEAHFIAGLATFCEHNPTGPSDPGWESAVSAKEHFAQVAPGSTLEGAAAAWRARIDLAAAGENTDAVLPQIREFVAKYKNDKAAMQIASVTFQRYVIESMWPIPLNATDIDGRPVSLDQYKGKVLLIDFWATWCGPCRGELPHLTAAYTEFHDRGFEILSVSLDYPERTSVDDYRGWVSEKGMNWRHVYETKEKQIALAEAYMVSGIPNPLLVGRDGRLLAIGDDCRGAVLAKSIEKALAGGTS